MSIKELEDKIKNIEKLLGDQRSFNFGNVTEQFKEINEKIKEINEYIEEIDNGSYYNHIKIEKIIKALEKLGVPKKDLEIALEDILESDLEKMRKNINQ